MTHLLKMDLGRLLIPRPADSSPFKVRHLIEYVKGIDNLATDIFFDTAQGLWPSLALFIIPRSLKIAEQCGFDSDVDRL